MNKGLCMITQEDLFFLLRRTLLADDCTIPDGRGLYVLTCLENYYNRISGDHLDTIIKDLRDILADDPVPSIQVRIERLIKLMQEELCYLGREVEECQSSS
jgi:hypothetical protein